LLWLLGLIVPLLTFVAIYAAHATGLTLFWWNGPIVVFGVIPIVDVTIGRDRSNPPDEALAALEQDRYYRWATYLYLPLQYAGLVLACREWAGGTLAWYESLGLAVTVGCVGGIAIATAHELGHKREVVERRLAQVALAQTAYGHFTVEHNRGHHVRVATLEDPASSRLGEGFWMFLPRTVIGSMRSAWRLERKRLRRLRRPLVSLSNDIIQAWLMTIGLLAALLIAFGPAIWPWLVIQAVFGFGLLEVVNYVEHYGLRRQRMPDGRYERVRPEHSWNSDSLATNVLLYHLQRHSDHHANPVRRYQALRSMDSAPELPAGYAAMILLAWVPPLWSAVMDRRVLALYGGDVTRANLQPHRRATLLARYGAEGTAEIEKAPDGDAPPASVTGSASATRWVCPACDYVYDEGLGVAREGFPAGTTWAEIPEDFNCPDCGVRDKADFVPRAA